MRACSRKEQFDKYRRVTITNAENGDNRRKSFEFRLLHPSYFILQFYFGIHTTRLYTVKNVTKFHELLIYTIKNFMKFNVLLSYTT